jgi:PKD repeat protein
MKPFRHPVRGAHSARRASGQSLVEFALVLPVFLVLIAVVLDLGRIAAAQVTVANASREGALQASTTPTSYQAGQPCPSANPSTNLVVCRTVLESRGSVVTVSPSDIQLVCTPASCTPGIGNTVTVTVTGRLQLLTPILAAFFGGNQTVTFRASTTAQIETLPTPPAATPTPTPTPTPSPTATPTPTPTPTQACSPPSAGFDYTTSPPSGQAPVTITVTDTSTPTTGGCITSWIWDWGNGDYFYGQNPGPYTYRTPGRYNVSLTVYGPGGSNTSGAVEVWVK